MLLALGSISAVVEMNTGEGVEEIMENLSGVSETFIERHDEAAETFSILSYFPGGISLLGLWASFTKKKVCTPYGLCDTHNG